MSVKWKVIIYIFPLICTSFGDIQKLANNSSSLLKRLSDEVELKLGEISKLSGQLESLNSRFKELQNLEAQIRLETDHKFGDLGTALNLTIFRNLELQNMKMETKFRNNSIESEIKIKNLETAFNSMLQTFTSDLSYKIENILQKTIALEATSTTTQQPATTTREQTTTITTEHPTTTIHMSAEWKRLLSSRTHAVLDKDYHKPPTVTLRAGLIPHDDSETVKFDDCTRPCCKNLRLTANVDSLTFFGKCIVLYFERNCGGVNYSVFPQSSFTRGHTYLSISTCN